MKEYAAFVFASFWGYEIVKCCKSHVSASRVIYAHQGSYNAVTVC